MAAAKHDTDWLGTVYQKHRRELFLAAWSVLRHVESAEDAVHTAFTRLALLTAPPREAKLYAFRSVRNAAIDIARGRRRRREESLESDWPEYDLAVPEFDAGATRAVAESLRQLDSASREVIELRLQAALTFAEISQILAEPLPTVASRYRRALEKLGKEIKAIYE